MFSSASFLYFIIFNLLPITTSASPINNNEDDIENGVLIAKEVGDSTADVKIRTKTDLFCEAVSNGNFPVVTAMLRDGVDINAADEKASRFYTALHYAAERGNVEMVRFLLDHGANVNAPKDVGFSALDRAAEMGQKLVVDLLLQRGADVNASDSTFKMTPLHYAVKGEPRSSLAIANKGNAIEIAKLLLKMGADVNAKDFLDQTPLMLAATAGKLDLVSLLVDSGHADIDAKSDEMTALQMAVDNGDIDNDKIVAFLLSRGANQQGCNHKLCNLEHRQ